MTLDEHALVRSLDGVEKVAVALLALGADAASRVLKHFNQDELRQIAFVASRLGAVPASALAEIYDALIEEIALGDVDLVGGAAQAESLLASALPEEKVADIMSELRGNSNAFFWRRLGTLPGKVLADALAKERPQTIAVVIGKLDPVVAAQVLSHLPGAARAQTMRRMLTTRPASESVLRVIEEVLQEELFATSSVASSADVGARVAGIINQLEAEQVNEILLGLDESEPALAAHLRTLVFGFEDIVRLGQRARMIVFDQAPTDRVILALRGADMALRELVLPCLSARTRRMVEAELSSPASPPRKEIMAAQREIANLVLRLAEQGLIELFVQDEESAS